MLTPAELDTLAEQISEIGAEKVAERLADQPVLVDRYQLAGKLQISVPTIDRKRKAGEIPTI